MNTVTPRVFIAATRQNDGKTTTSLGLIAALQQHFPRVGFIKPVGQRFVEVEGHKVMPGTRTFDLASGGVELKVCDDIAPKIPEDVKAKLDEIKKGIVDGSIKVAKAK